MVAPTYQILNSGLANSQDFYPVELMYNVPAAGTQWPLIQNQGTAQGIQWVLTGTGAVSLSPAIAQTLAAPINGSPISQNPGNLNLATGLVTYFTNVPAAAPGVYCIGFIVAGVQFSGFIKAEITVTNQESAVAVNPARIIGNYNPATNIPQPITLSGTNTLLKNPNDPTSGIVYGTDTIVMVPDLSLIFGAFKVFFTGDAPTAADVAGLRLWLTP